MPHEEEKEERRREDERKVEDDIFSVGRRWVGDLLIRADVPKFFQKSQHQDSELSCSSSSFLL
jgi:hypothetical protein